MVTPADEATVIDDDEDDQRQYTVTNPVAGADHQIVLFDANNVDVGTNDLVSFEENGNEAQTGTPAAVITVVNGTSTGTGGVVATEASPAGGEISFTVEGEGFGSVVPVVYFDEDEDGDLDVNDDGEPTEDEVFGIGGTLNVLPVEAGTGALDNDSEILSVNKDENFVVVDLNGIDSDAGDVVARTLSYDDSDDFFETAPTVGNQLSLDDFEDILTVGDALVGTTDEDGTVYSRSFDSQFVLLNTEPGEPTIDNASEGDLTAADAGIDEATFDVTDLNDDADTVTIYFTDETVEGDFIDFDADDFESATFDADDDEGTNNTTDNTWELTATGLDEDTSFVAYATQTVDGEESSESEGVTFTTNETTAPITINDAVLETDTITTGTPDAGDVVELTLSGVASIGDDGRDAIIAEVQDEDGDIAVVQCVADDAAVLSDSTALAAALTAAGDNTAAACEDVQEGTGDDEYDVLTVTLLEEAKDDNVAGDDELNWPLTIRAIQGLEDGAGRGIDIANSDDVLIDDES